MFPSSTDEAIESSTSHEPERLRSDTRNAPSPIRTVLVCGASVRSLAESLLSTGYTPLCIDFFGDSDLRQLLERSGGQYLGTMKSFRELPERIADVPADVPLVWGGGLENEPDILEQIACQRRICGVSLDLVRRLRAPQTLDELLHGTALLRPRRNSRGEVQLSRGGGCWLRKPCRSGGGLGIEFWDCADAGCEIEDGTYLEEYIEGLPCSVVAYGDGQGHATLIGASLLFSGLTELGATGFQFCGNLGPVELSGAMHLEVSNAVKTLASRTYFGGIVGLDLVASPKGVFLLEVNPRVTASHWLYELDLPGRLVSLQVAEGALGAGCPAGPARVSVAGSARVGAQWIVWSRQAQEVPDLMPVQLSGGLRFADVPEPGALAEPGTPLCSLLATGASAAQLIDILTENPSALHKVGIDVVALQAVLRQRLELAASLGVRIL